MFSGSIAALLTPFTDDGRIDISAWVDLLHWHRRAGTCGIVVAGTTGESVCLSEKEFEQLLALALEQVGDAMTVLAGTGSPSTRDAVLRTRLAASMGAHAALVVTPAYNRPKQSGLEAHYLAVADESAVPIVLYNVPSRTACDLLPETVARLAEHEAIVAIKEAVGDMNRIRALLRTGLVVLSGDDPSCLSAMQAGAAGVISVAANVVPGRFARLCELAISGNGASADAMNRELVPLYRFLGVESNPIPAKWMLHRMGRIRSTLRLPLTTLDAAFHDEAEQLIERLQLDVMRDVA